MDVVENEEHAWILFRYEDKLLLDVHCNHTVFGYSVLIALKPHEEQAYLERGRDYLHELAQAVHESAPIVRGSTSQYKGRDLTKELGEATTKVFINWKSRQKTEES